MECHNVLPARFAFLTGQSAARTNHTAVCLEKHVLPYSRMIQPKSNRMLAHDAVNIGRVLKQSGYRVGAIGKWHVDINEKRLRSKMKDDYLAQWDFDTIKPVRTEGDEKLVMGSTIGLLNYLKEDQSKPVFAYLAHRTVHTGLYAPKDIIQKYVDMGYKNDASKGSGSTNAIYLAMIDYLD